MNSFFLITLILCFFFIRSYSIHDTIEEMISKSIIFEIQDYNSYKIYKYVPSCTESSILNKSINFHIISNKDIYFYKYQNFSLIEQNKNGEFINFQERYYIFYSTLDEVHLIRFNLTCEKEYYFIFSISNSRPYFSSTIVNFLIAEEKDKINLDPSLSNSFIIYQTNPPKTIFYSHNETKYCSLFFSYKSNIQVFKNDEIIYNKIENKDSIQDTIEFEKNQNYTIYFDGKEYPLINIQFFNEPKIFKHNFEEGPILLFKRKYYFEINISRFQLDDIILFKFYANDFSNYAFKYQYKENFIGNNFIDLGYHVGQNYIPIKKKVNDSSLIIYIEYHSIGFSLLSIIQNKIEEIKSEYNNEINGPKYFYINYFEINNLNSIGIGANELFFFYEEKKSYETKISSTKYQKYYITKTNNYETNSFNSAIIYFNSTNKILFEIKKYNFPIFLVDLFVIMPDNEFFQLCQGENTLNELCFYTTADYFGQGKELFTPVFGSFDSYYIKEEKIKVLQDFDFDIIKESNFFQTYNETGYLKIKCNEALMLKHSFLNFDYDRNLSSGHKYYINDDDIKDSTYSFNISLINENLQIKITIFGLEPKQSIKLIFNNNTYTLTNTPFELNFTYEKYSPNLLYFEVGKEIQNLLLGEIIVGLLPEDINLIFKQIDFINSFGSLSLKEKEGVIIKVPYNFTQDLYDFSIIFPKSVVSSRYLEDFYVDISYDKIEFQSIYYKSFKNKISPIIPLFKVNPYDIIKKDLLDSNKFFYIVIYNYYSENKILIKKPMLYSNIKFNKINILPQLKGNNTQYYYQIKIPESEGNYNSLLAQVINTGYLIKISFSKFNVEYPLISEYSFFDHHFNIPFDRRDKNEYSFINYYDIDNGTGYINLVETNEHIYKDYFPIFELEQKIQQIQGKNKLKIKLNSLSYVFYPNIVKYYVIFNVENNIDILYSFLTKQKEPNKDLHQFMVILEDNGEKEIFEKEIEVKIDLIEDSYNKNKAYFFPINTKTNLVEKPYTVYTEFEYKNLSFIQKKKTNIVLIILLILIIIIIIIAIVLIILKYRKKSNSSFDKTDLTEEMNPIYKN